MTEPPAVSRRGLLAGMAGASASSLLSLPASAAPQAATAPLPGLVGRDPLWAEQLSMNRLGPKLTGSPAHLAYIDRIARQLAAIPGVRLERRPVPFRSWRERHAALELRADGTAPQPLDVTSAYPYSGATPEGGVAAELAFGGRTPDFRPKDCRGRIAFIEAPILPMRFADFLERWGPADAEPAMPAALAHPVFQHFCAPDLRPFRDAGAVGAILAWQGVADAAVRDQYVPFSKPYQDLPALWVGEQTGRRLKAAIGQGGQARLTLLADQDEAASSDALLAMLPGQSDETILVLTHTDGGNALEENGPLVLVALARYLAGLPAGTLRRSYAFAFETAHFARGPVAAKAGLPPSAGNEHPLNLAARHPDLIRRTVACVAIEHLGADEWETADGGYAATGRSALGWAITPSRALADLLLSTAPPDSRLIAARPTGERFMGEGGMAHRAGVPTLGFVPLPAYLLTAPAGGEIAKIDPDRLHRQTAMFARLLTRLDRVPAAALGAG